MNQILVYTNTKQNSPVPIKSILKFFSISLIILGAIFIFKGSYSLFQNSTIGKTNNSEIIPNIVFEQEVNNAIITVSHNVGISKIKYNWNDESPTIKQANFERNVIIDNISIPKGINTLYVTVIDENGKTSEKSFEYAYDGISIDLALVSSDKQYIQISASDLKGLSYITYKWNNDEEITAYPSNEDKTIIETQTEIPAGINTLSVTAVNSQNKTLTKSLDVEGNYPPKISMYLQGDELIVIVTDDEGLQTILQRINSEETRYDLSGETRYEYRVPVQGDQNLLVRITAIDVKGVGRTFNGKNY